MTPGDGVAPSVVASVIIPAYNAAATLDAQLEALERQVGAPLFEVLVCDNGSADSTVEVARAFAGRLERLSVIDASASRGAGAARNAGVARSSGTVALFCDADDVVADDWVAAMCESAATNAVVAGGWEFTRINEFHGHTNPASPPIWVLPYLPQFDGNGAGNLGIHTEVFKAVGGFDANLMTGEDADLCIRLQLAGHAIHPCPEAIVHVRLKTTARGAARQAYEWGRADRKLKRKYATLIVTPPREPLRSRVRALAHGTLALRHRAGRLIASAAVGRWLGSRFARIPRGVEPIASAA